MSAAALLLSFPPLLHLLNREFGWQRSPPDLNRQLRMAAFASGPQPPAPDGSVPAPDGSVPRRTSTASSSRQCSGRTSPPATAERVSEDVPEKMSEKLLEDTPEKCQSIEHMPENMSEAMPEDMHARKSADVMFQYMP